MSKAVIFDGKSKQQKERPATAQELADREISAQQANQQHNDEMKTYRLGAYISEADPLYFGWRRGENTEQEWLDKVAEIRLRYPYK